jgi:hypothetical protein
MSNQSVPKCAICANTGICQSINERCTNCVFNSMSHPVLSVSKPNHPKDFSIRKVSKLLGIDEFQVILNMKDKKNTKNPTKISN